MSNAVLRIYDNAPGFVDSLVGREDEVKALLTSVEGFRTWGLIRTETGGMTATICDTAEGCAETVSIAANWVAQNFADRNWPPPRVLQGEITFNAAANRPEIQPYVRVGIFSEPGPSATQDHLDAVRTIVTGTPGFRSYTVFQTGDGTNVHATVADDKASGDELVRRLREWLRTTFPDFRRADPQVIEGQAVKRIVAETVAA